MEGRPVTLNHRAHPAPEPAFTITENRWRDSPRRNRLWREAGYGSRQWPFWAIAASGRRSVRYGRDAPARQSAHPRQLAPRRQPPRRTPQKQDGGPGAAALTYMFG